MIGVFMMGSIFLGIFILGGVLLSLTFREWLKERKRNRPFVQLKK